jgi:hypothetical protein
MLAESGGAQAKYGDGGSAAASGLDSGRRASREHSSGSDDEDMPLAPRTVGDRKTSRERRQSRH